MDYWILKNLKAPQKIFYIFPLFISNFLFKYLCGLVFSVCNIISELLQHNTSIFPASGGRDIIPILLQSIKNLLRSLPISLFPLSVKFCHDFIKSDHPNLCAIRKFQHSPTNCRCFRLSSDSSFYRDLQDFILYHILFPSFFQAHGLFLRFSTTAI